MKESIEKLKKEISHLKSKEDKILVEFAKIGDEISERENQIRELKLDDFERKNSPRFKVGDIVHHESSYTKRATGPVKVLRIFPSRDFGEYCFFYEIERIKKDGSPFKIQDVRVATETRLSPLGEA